MRLILAFVQLCLTLGIGYGLVWAFSDPAPSWAEDAPAEWKAGAPDVAAILASLHLGSEAQAALPPSAVEALAQEAITGGRIAPPFEGLGMTQAALTLTQAAEPLRLEAERNDEGVWVIGYGRRIAEQPTNAISADFAEQMLGEDIALAEEAVRSNVHLPLNANEFGALVEFARSIGPDNFASTLVPILLNAGDREAAADAFLIWSTVRVDGALVNSEDLIAQRTRTRDLFLTPMPATTAVALNP